MTIAAIVCVLRSERSQRLYGNQSSAIVTIAAIDSDRMFSAIVTIVNDHMETRLKNSKNRGFLRFLDTGILTTTAILMTAWFTLIGKSPTARDIYL